MCVLQKNDQEYRVRVQQLVYNYEKCVQGAKVIKHYVWKACKGYTVCIATAQHTIIA